jgi:hypothetical protein
LGSGRWPEACQEKKTKDKQRQTAPTFRQGTDHCSLVGANRDGGRRGSGCKEMRHGL